MFGMHFLEVEPVKGGQAIGVVHEVATAKDDDDMVEPVWVDLVEAVPEFDGVWEAAGDAMETVGVVEVAED